MALDAEYRDYFVRNLHDALSGHTSNNVDEAVRYSERSLAKVFPFVYIYNNNLFIKEAYLTCAG